MSTTVRYGSNRDGRSNHVCPPGISRVPPESISGTPLTIQQAKEAVENYVARLGYSNLRVGEVIEFAQSYYAIVKESDTGIGAMELLVDKGSGFVGLEYGPNAMWNARYGMMGGSASGKMTISSQEALKIAERWLDTYRPGQAPEPEPDAFYGYYTIRTLKDGQISGMLSVQGSSGQVWYHNWHGAFVERIGR